ncbi:hypothetical protein [Acinetobacter seifertii]|uniref:Uncharacterized protein n=1 Tax=Acinetobacter seifertii TaxID=1530123 RepID=A0ABX8L894_9GAMM|nr:hypothetical protein [Acinetobacter seifertii]MBJ9425378.1 hypothetical protein [Acinetobacter seifertii]QXB47219.1 hypothetical protein I6L30_04210 [Acinetobacter seifertii]
MKYIKYIFAALVIALSAPTFAKDHGYRESHHGYGHAYHGMHHGKAYAYHGNHHGKGYYHNKAHRERGFERHHDRRGHW